MSSSSNAAFDKVSPVRSAGRTEGSAPDGPIAQETPSGSHAAAPAIPRPAVRTNPKKSRTGRREYIPNELINQNYRLVRQLGVGGMGEVWVAKNEMLDVHVAIKLIKSDIEAPHLTDRLMQEARAAAQLQHPAIVRVADLGQTDAGDPFLVMELLHGEDLGKLLDRRTRLSPRKAVQTLLPIAHALAEAHSKGIVHRDLKPDNVFLEHTDRGRIQPKLVDFGIVKLEKEGFERLTRVGSVLGSPAYMCPEQVRGEDVDHKADLWALCVALYQCVAGELPFVGSNYNALMFSIARDEPQPLAGDHKLWAILRRGFNKEPTLRWATMRDLGQALAAWLIEQGTTEDISGESLEAAWFQDNQRDAFASIAPPTLAQGQLVLSLRRMQENATVAIDVPVPLADDDRPATPPAEFSRSDAWLTSGEHGPMMPPATPESLQISASVVQANAQTQGDFAATQIRRRRRSALTVFTAGAALALLALGGLIYRQLRPDVPAVEPGVASLPAAASPAAALPAPALTNSEPVTPTAGSPEPEATALPPTAPVESAQSAPRTTPPAAATPRRIKKKLKDPFQ